MSTSEVTLYLQAVGEGAAVLLQDFPLVGAVCDVFLSFTRVVETAKSNKDGLSELQELFDLVLKGAVQRRMELQKTGAASADGLDDVFAKLPAQIERATEIAKKCRGNAMKQFLFSRRTSKDIEAAKKSVTSLCTTNTLILSNCIHVSLLLVSRVVVS